MIWQDAVVGTGQWLFALSLIPMFKQPPPLLSSIPTGIMLGAFAVAFGSLGMWLASASSTVSAALWLALAVQRTKTQEIKDEGKER